jgi:colicin import membrane protein
VSLVFEPPRGCFAGKAKAELGAGPVELGISAKGAANANLGRMEKIALLVDVSHGGEVLVAGDYSAEIVLDGNGKSVLAFVADASGKASADANLDVKVGFDADAGSMISLEWDPKRLCYHGSLSADADFDVKPIRLEIAAAGRAFVGAAASLRAVADARLKAAAKADAAVDLKGSAKLDADAKAKANLKADIAAPKANAKVSVAAPKVNVDEKASASAKAGAKAGGGAKAGAKAKGSIKVGF